MFNANDVLGMLLERGMGARTQERINHGFGASPSKGGGGLADIAEVLLGRKGASGREAQQGGGIGDILGQMLGGGASSGGRAQGGGLGDVLGQVLGGGGQAGQSVPSAGRGGPLGGPGGASGRSRTASAPVSPPQTSRKTPQAKPDGGIGLGGLAVLGTLGMLAYRMYAKANEGQKPGASAMPAGSAGTPAGDEDLPPPFQQKSPEEEDAAARVVIAAMINAAKADGKLDREEAERILGRLGDEGASPDAQAFIRDEAAKPFDLERIAREVPDPNTAVQVYLASLLAIDVDSRAEEDYLRDLAQRLSIPPQVVSALRQQVGVRV